jgi:hypothetical protein
MDSHDSHYVTVKKHPEAKQYYPCPRRQQPDFDEIVVFKPQRIIPTAFVSFQRRRKTLLWLDDNPESPENKRIRSKIPGATWLDELIGVDQPNVKVKSVLTEKHEPALKLIGASGPHAETVNGVYLQMNKRLCCGQHVYCKQGDDDTWIEYDSPRRQWQVKDTAHCGNGGWALASVAHVMCEPIPSLEVCSKSGIWKVAISESHKDRISYKLNSVALDKQVVEQPINHEDQVDVTLFKSVEAIVAFLSDVNQLKFAKYPPSLFRIICNRRLFFGHVTVTCCDTKEFMCFGGISSLVPPGGELMFEGEHVFGGVETGVKYYLSSSRSSRNGELFSVSREREGPPVLLKPQRFDAAVSMSILLPKSSLLKFLEGNPVWKRLYPAICVFHGGAEGDRLSSLRRKRPNFMATNQESKCEAFVSFQSLTTLAHN